MIKGKTKDRAAHAKKATASVHGKEAGRYSLTGLTAGSLRLKTPVLSNADYTSVFVNDIAVFDSGFAIRKIKDTSQSTGLSVKEIIETMGMSERTYERRRVSGKLTIDESDKLVRIARLYNMALEIFGETSKVNEWLKKPSRAFAGRTPLEMAKTEVGGRQVENMLGAMQHGVFY